MATFGTILAAKSAAKYVNNSNSFIVLLSVGFSAGDLAGASNSNIYVILDANGNQLDSYIASTAAGEFNSGSRRAIVPPGGKVSSDLTNGVNAQYVSCTFEELVNWV